MERRIYEELKPWLEQRTVLIMAHRLSTIMRLPRVVVLHGGRIQGDGPVSELVETCPPFRLLFLEQFSPLDHLPDPKKPPGPEFSKASDPYITDSQPAPDAGPRVDPEENPGQETDSTHVFHAPVCASTTKAED
jgi:hypothetical protein